MDTSMPVLDIYEKDTQYCHREIFTSMLLPYYLTRMWNEAVYPSTDEQIIEIWYINTIDFYSAIKKKIKYET